MMSRALILILSFGPLASCNANARPANASTNQEHADNAEALRTTPTGLIFRGKELNLGTPISQWIAALGSDFREAKPNPAISVLVWDQIGIKVYPSSIQDHRVTTVTLTLKHRDRSAAGFDISPPGTGLEPASVYGGTVLLEDLPISAGKSVRALRAAAKDHWLFNCTKGISVCFARRVDQPPDQLSKSFSVDSSSEYSPLYTMELHRNSW